MTKICIFTSKAVSLKNVGRDIAYIAQNMGMVPRLFDYIIPPFEVPNICDKAVYVMTYSPVWCTHWVLNAYDVYKHGKGIPVIFYGTVEGKIKKHHIRDWMKNAVPYVANSKYTYEKLVEVGLNVVNVVYHGVNFNEIAEAKKLAKSAKEFVRRKTGEGVVFGAILSDHPRKGHELLLEGFLNARSKNKNIKLYIVTNKSIPQGNGIVVDNKFGNYSRVEVLALTGAFDYLIIPSLCEGFGLPLVEANAMGIPVIHCMYPPLSEITCDANITFPYYDVKLEDLQEGILYEYHLYDSKNLAEAIIEASEIASENKEEYGKMKAKVKQHSRKFSVEKLYPKLLEILGKV